VPITLGDINPSENGSANLDFIVLKNPHKAPVGTFYSPDTVESLIATLRGRGSSSEVTLAQDATEQQRVDFNKFKDRMESGQVVRHLTLSSSMSNQLPSVCCYGWIRSVALLGVRTCDSGAETECPCARFRQDIGHAGCHWGPIGIR
jgi:hypothetical protein